MKIRNDELYDFVNDLGTLERPEFEVYFDDVYSGNIKWNGNYFEWESGKFTSEIFFNPLYEFVEIKKPKKIEKIEFNNLNDFVDESGYVITTTDTDIYVAKKINEIIDKINELGE